MSADEFGIRYLQPSAERFQREMEIDLIKSVRGFYDPRLSPLRLPS